MEGTAEGVRVTITTLGCRANQYDSSAIEDSLKEANFKTVPFPNAADVYIINTCTVTGRTDCQSRQLIRRVRRQSPASMVIVTGCYAQVSPREVAGLAGVDYVLGNAEKTLVVECIRKGRPEEGPVTLVGPHERGTPLSLRAINPLSRTRVNLKVQDGCDRECSYCIIPMARGVSKSVALNDVLREAEGLIEKGFKEIVLTGIHLGSYGGDLVPRLSITDLLMEIENRRYPCRFRISSLDPDEVTDGLIDILKGASTVCNHLHLALQSGDDAILKRMRRPSTAGYFAERVGRLSREVPGISIGADVIAGFPGEGEREFENTFNFIKDLPLAYLHVFPYSRRRNTAAQSYPGHVNEGVKKWRVKALLDLDGEKREGFYRGFLNRDADVLFEKARDRKTGLLKGRTRNYIPVVMDGPDGFEGKEVRVRLLRIADKGMCAAI